MSAPLPLLKGFERTAASTKPDPDRRLLISDPDTRGLYLRIMPSGQKSWTVISRDRNGKQVWAVLGDFNEISLDRARARARDAVRRIKEGLPAIPTETKSTSQTINEVYRTFITRHVEKLALRSGKEVQRIFRVYVLPTWGERQVADIKRGEVARLLDEIEDYNGPVMADRVLAALSKLFNWYASREDHFTSPIVRGMGRTRPSERARNRALCDFEIRLLWAAAANAGAFGASLQMALLTGQRRAKVGMMQWDHIDAGVWNIPTEAREKANAGKLRLPALALSILDARPKTAQNPYVFAGQGLKAIGGHSKCKRRLDAEMTILNGGEPISAWVIHDLRRTAKGLMARAGVRRDISERVLGHAIPGVEGVYDRHDYFEEKAEALSAAASLLSDILESSGQRLSTR